jgi:hypothetical protein
MRKQTKVSQWVTDKEMASIRADVKLVSGLKAGSNAACKEKGRVGPSVRKGWAKAFKKMAQNGDDGLLI